MCISLLIIIIVREPLDAILPIFNSSEGISRIVNFVKDGTVEIAVARRNHRIKNFFPWVESFNKWNGMSFELGAEL
jgi:hypothetical protein